MEISDSPFEAHDLTAAVAVNGVGESKFAGTERRRAFRRHNTDRRAEVRFEVDNSDRRDGAGRRGDDNRVVFW